MPGARAASPCVVGDITLVGHLATP